MASDTPPSSRRSSSKKRSPKEDEIATATATATITTQQPNAETPTPAPTPTAVSSSQQQPYADLIRNPEPYMQHANLLTGLYGTRGERIRHVVYKGALSLPESALKLLQATIQQDNAAAGTNRSFSPKTYELPGIDSVVRPLADPKFPTVTVTDVYSTIVPEVLEMGAPAERRTIVKNRVVTKVPMRSNSNSITTTLAAADSPGDAERIRGGGEGEEEAGKKKNDAIGVAMPNITITFGDPPAPRAALTPPEETPSTTTPEATTQIPVATPVLAASVAPVSAVSAPVAPPVFAPLSSAPVPTALLPSPLPIPAASAAAAVPPSNLDSKPAAVPFTTTVTAVPVPSPLQPPPQVVQATMPMSSSATPPQPTTTAAATTIADPVQNLTATPTSTAPTAPTVPVPVNTGSLQAPTMTAATMATSVPTQPVASIETNKTVVPVPTPVSSAPAPAPVPAKPQVVGLKKRPAPQWEQHTPGANDEMQVDPANKTPPPEWYKADAVSDLEYSLLPEWFDGSAPHRTTQSYLKARETMIQMSDTLGNRYITSTMVRRCIPGDAGSLMRLHACLSSYALINDDAMNDSAPTPLVLQKPSELKGPAAWNETLRDDLMEAVVEQQSSKRPKLDPNSMDTDSTASSSSFLPLNWDAVAAKVGHGTTPNDCEREFLALPLDEDIKNGAPREGSITPDGEPRDTDKTTTSKLTKLEIQQEIFQELVAKSDPSVIHAVTEASLKATDKLADAQKAGIYGLVAGQAAQEARSHEDSVARVLSEIVDLRMKKLENRMSLMDDIEGMLEAERIALELERRDLYTARCRTWFGGP